MKLIEILLKEAYELGYRFEISCHHKSLKGFHARLVDRKSGEPLHPRGNWKTAGHGLTVDGAMMDAFYNVQLKDESAFTNPDDFRRRVENGNVALDAIVNLCEKYGRPGWEREPETKSRKSYWIGTSTLTTGFECERQYQIITGNGVRTGLSPTHYFNANFDKIICREVRDFSFSSVYVELPDGQVFIVRRSQLQEV